MTAQRAASRQYTVFGRILLVGALSLLPAVVAAQADTARALADSGVTREVRRAARHPHYWRDFAAGFAASLLLHESAHVATAIAVGGHPSLGFDKGRPTVYSGLDAIEEPQKQFLFSSMGLNVQAALDEAILDVPHRRGAPFERGVLASGIATALFYVTLGRTASVSDMDFMARTSSLSKMQLSLIYGGVAVMHAVRVSRDDRYANFFMRPDVAHERTLIGVRIE